MGRFVSLPSLIGSILVAGLWFLVAWLCPRIIQSESWRAEVDTLTAKETLELNTKNLILTNGANFDRMFSLTNLTTVELQQCVSKYSSVTYVNASTLVQTTSGFRKKWTENRARGMFLENAALVDSGIMEFPSESSYFTAVLCWLMGMVPLFIIVSSMTYVHFEVLTAVYDMCTGLNNVETKESRAFFSRILRRSVFLIVVSLLMLIVVTALVTLHGWLESGKTWGGAKIAYYAMLSLVGAGRSPARLPYLDGELDIWVAAVHFAVIILQASYIGLLVLACLRWRTTLDSKLGINLSEAEVAEIWRVDDKNVDDFVRRPLYHN